LLPRRARLGAPGGTSVAGRSSRRPLNVLFCELPPQRLEVRQSGIAEDRCFAIDDQVTRGERCGRAGDHRAGGPGGISRRPLTLGYRAGVRRDGCDSGHPLSARAARFVETARKLGCDESEEAFDRAFRKIVQQKRATKTSS